MKGYLRGIGVSVALLAGLALVPAAPAQNSNFYLVADDGGGPPGDDLLTLENVATLVETPIGTGTSTVSMEGAARYPAASFITQTLFGATASRLYRLNKTTGVATALASTYGSGPGPLGTRTFDDVDGIAFDATTSPVIMYGTVRREGGGSPSDLLIRINYNTGAHVAAAWGANTDYLAIQNQGAGLHDIDDIAIRSSDGAMYAINNNSGAEDRLVIIDKNTAATTDVGRLRRSDDSEDVDDMEGLDFDCNNTLWGVTGQNSSDTGQRNRIWVFQTDVFGDPTRFVSEVDHMLEGSDYESIVGCVVIGTTPTPSPSPEVPTPSRTPSPSPTATPYLSEVCLRVGHATLSSGATSATSFVNSGLELTLWAPATTSVVVLSSHDCSTGISTEAQTGFWDLRMDNTWSSQTIGRYLSGNEDLGLSGAIHLFENVSPGNHVVRLRHKSNGTTDPQIVTRDADMVAFDLTVEDGSARFNYGTSVLDATGDTTSNSSFEDVDGLSCTVTLDIPGRIFVSCALNGESSGGAAARMGFWRLQVDGTTVGVAQEHRKLSGSADLGAVLLHGLTDNLCAGTYTVTVQHRTSDIALPVRTLNATLLAVALSTADAGGLELPAAQAASETFNDTTSTTMVDAATSQVELNLQTDSDIVVASNIASHGIYDGAPGDRYGFFDLTLDGSPVSETVSRFYEETGDHAAGGIYGMGPDFSAATHTGYIRFATNNPNRGISLHDLAIVLLGSCANIGQPPCATPTPSPTPTPEPSPTPSPSPEPTKTPSPTATPTAEPTKTPSPTATPTAEPTKTPSPTATPTAEPTKTPSPTATPTAEPTKTPSPTATPTAEPTKTPSPTATPTAEPTKTPSPTATPTAEPTKTPSPTATPTAEPTKTPSPTATPTAEPTKTPSPTATPTAEPTKTPSPTATPTAEPSATPSPSTTPTPSVTPTATPSPTPTPSPSASPTPEPSATPSPSASPTANPTSTPSPRPSATPSPRPSATPSPRPSATPSPAPSASPSPVPTPDCHCYVMPQQTLYNTYENILMLVHPEVFNPNTNETVIGPTGATGIEAMDYNEADGLLYGINYGQLGTIDLVTGVFTPKGQPIGAGYGSLGYQSFRDCDGMSFRHSDGVLFASVRKGENDLLIQVDHVTGAHIAGAFSGDDYIVIEEVPDSGDDDIDDIAFDTADDTLYATANDAGRHDHLITINPVDGSIEEIAELYCPLAQLAVQDMEGLGFGCDGILWGTTGKYTDPQLANRLWEINKDTGHVCNPRRLGKASDYEAVTCGKFRIPPTPAPTPALAAAADGDYDGDGVSDVAIYRPSTGQWSVRGITRFYFGSAADLPVPGDYDGNGRADAAVFRGSSGLWAVNALTRLIFGIDGDYPAVADYNGDGTSDIGIFRPGLGFWSVRGMEQDYFGVWGDLPVPGDYSGDGTAAPAIFRPVTGLWSARDAGSWYLGTAGDLPVPGDYRGTGPAAAAIFRPATGLWTVLDFTRFWFGSSADHPVPADFWGDGKDAAAVFREADGLWAVRALTRAAFGLAGDLPATR